MSDTRRPEPAGGVVEVATDDVRQLSGQGQDSLAAAADEDRRMGLLHWHRQPGKAAGVDIRAVDGHLVAAPVGLHQANDFSESGDANTRPIHRDAESLVLGGHPARSETDFDPTIREQIERRHLLGQHHRMVKVDVEDAATDPQIGCDRRRRCHGGDRRDVDRSVAGRVRDRTRSEVVIGREQRAVTQGFRAARRCRAIPCQISPRMLEPRSETDAVGRRPWTLQSARRSVFDECANSTSVQ